MKKITLNYAFGFIFCLINLSAFSQSSENVIVLEMPNPEAQISASTEKTAPANDATAETINAIVSDTPIYIADGVVIKNLNVLDPATIISVDVADNKIIITTTNGQREASDNTALASNI